MDYEALNRMLEGMPDDNIDISDDPFPVWDDSDDIEDIDDFDNFDETGDDFDDFPDPEEDFDDFDNSDDPDGDFDPGSSDKRKGHRGRMRGRVSVNGMEEYSQQQVLELLLCYVMPRQDVKKVIDQLMEYYGDLKSLFRSDLEEFRRFEGLGEGGAQWLDTICNLVRAFSRLRLDDAAKIANFRQLRLWANALLGEYGTPCCLQLVTDRDDFLMFTRLLCRDERWGETRCIIRAVEDAARMEAANAYLLVLTDDPLAHPTEYDRIHLRDYALLMKHIRCDIRDVLFVNRDHCVSLNRTGQIPDMTPFIFSPLAEDEKDAPLVLDELIVRSYPETDPFQSI